MCRNSVIRRLLASLLCCLLLLSTFAPAFAFEKTSEKYKQYVDQAIPLSFKVAEIDAKRREQGVFKDLLSEAQSHLSHTSDGTVLFGELMPLMKEGTSFRKPDGSVDLDESLQQLFISVQMINSYVKAKNHLDAYKKIKEGLPSQCDKNFDNYNIENVNTDFSQPEVELADGIYIEGPNVWKMLVTLFESIWQLFDNKSEQEEIERQAQRLEKERAKTSHYREFAVKHCKLFIPEHAKYFVLYDLLANSYQHLLDVIPIEKLQARHEALRAGVESFGTQLLAQLEAQARARVLAKLNQQNEQDALVSMSTRAVLRVAAAVNALNLTPCGSGDSLVESIKADIALFQLYKLPQSETVIPLVKTALERRRLNCNEVVPLELFIRTSSPLSTIRVSRMKQDRHLQLGRASDALKLQPVAAANRDVGLQICVFGQEYAYPSFCRSLETGPTSSSPGFGAYTTPGGGFCLNSSVGSYSQCGGSPYLIGTPSIDPWGIVRSAIAIAQHLPGSYSFKRGQFEGEKLDAHLNAVRERVAQIDDVIDEFTEEHDKYFEETVTPSVNKTIATIPGIEQDINDQLIPKLHDITLTGPPPVTPVGPPTEVASEAFRKYAETIDEAKGHPAEVWDRLEPVWQVAQTRISELPESDRRAISEIYQKYFDSNGLLNNEVLPANVGNVAHDLSAVLQTSSQTLEGKLVRYQVNRGLVAATNSTDPDLQLHALGGLALAAGADLAYGTGEEANAQRLIAVASQTLDFALGFIPVVSTINDATQIIYGMVTGRDYTGVPMGAGDYALRGLGVVLGILPAGGQVVKLGETLLGRAFEHGCQLLRRLDLEGRLHSAVKAGRALAADFAEQIGRWFPSHVVVDLPTTDLATNVNKVIDAQQQLIKNIAKGKEFEDQVKGVLGAPKKYDRILQGTATDAAFRVPDILNTTDMVLGEIKAVKNLGLTTQLQDFIGFCKESDYSFSLYVKPDTTLSSELRKALKEIGASVYDVTEAGELTLRKL
jgi:hypothetical protein